MPVLIQCKAHVKDWNIYRKAFWGTLAPVNLSNECFPIYIIEETQQLESPHRLPISCCQIPSLSPGLSYDQRCYQWFTGIYNYLMDTYPSSSASQSNEETHSSAKWSLSERLMSNPDSIFCRSDGCKKVKKAHYWLLNKRTPFQFWIWWWRHFYQNCRG